MRDIANIMSELTIVCVKLQYGSVIFNSEIDLCVRHCWLYVA